MVVLTIDISDDLLAASGEDRAAFERRAREAIVLDLVRRGQISMGRGARELGIERLAFMRLASASGIPVFDLSADEWRAEVQRIADQ
jgi:predicted HTH domain antitoxin